MHNDDDPAHGRGLDCVRMRMHGLGAAWPASNAASCGQLYTVADPMQGQLCNVFHRVRGPSPLFTSQCVQLYSGSIMFWCVPSSTLCSCLARRRLSQPSSCDDTAAALHQT